MAGDILGYNAKPGPQKAKAKSGGETSARDVRAYKTPYGPSSLGNSGPGLGGDNFGNAGSQGKNSLRCGEGGSPGLGGKKHSSGSQR